MTNLTDKIAVVAQRRNTMIAVQNVNLRKMTLEWQDKITSHAALQSQEESAHTRQTRWLTLLTAVQKMQALGGLVAMARATKAKDIRA